MMRVCSAAVATPSALVDTFVELNATRVAQLAELVQVYTVRFTFVVGAVGSFPRRRTSAAPPFSAESASGRSENALPGILEHWPALDGEKSQYAPLSVVQ